MSIRDKIIKFADLTDAQVEFVVSHLYLVPGLIRITFEIIPAYVIMGEDEREDIAPYDESHTIKEYLDDYHSELTEYRKADCFPLEWNKRMLVNVTGRYPEATDLTRWDYYDIQSMWPIGMDVWSCRAENMFMTCIAPLALLMPETWKLYGMEVHPEDPRYMLPTGIAGKGKGSAVAVWQAIGGTQDTLSADDRAASICTIDKWEMSEGTKLEWCAVVQEFFAHAKERLGEEKFNELRPRARQIFLEETPQQEPDEEEEE